MYCRAESLLHTLGFEVIQRDRRFHKAMVTFQRVVHDRRETVTIHKGGSISTKCERLHIGYGDSPEEIHPPLSFQRIQKSLKFTIMEEKVLMKEAKDVK